MAMLSGFFGALAALVAMVGLYGMISYAVAQRRQEIGIRFALGANRSILAARSAGSLLFQLSPDDPRTLLAACGALAAIALLASYLPARRASRLDPLVALRQD
jgi:ABC-type antimicrobial peptide transport system permease subunit